MNSTMNAACHCGAVRFEVALSDGLNTARRCTCSFCRMRGAVAVSAELGGLRFLAGEDKLTRYTFNTGAAQHFFCCICGIYTHHQRRSNPNQFGVNAACLEGVSPFDFAEIPVLDGVSHPSDAAPGTPERQAGASKAGASKAGASQAGASQAGARQVGTLRFEPVG